MERSRRRDGDRNPGRSKRTHTWHASYGVLALMTGLLALNGCDRKAPGEQVGQDMRKNAGSLKDNARAGDGAKAKQLGENLQKQ